MRPYFRSHDCRRRSSLQMAAASHPDAQQHIRLLGPGAPLLDYNNTGNATARNRKLSLPGDQLPSDGSAPGGSQRTTAAPREKHIKNKMAPDRRGSRDRQQAVERNVSEGGTSVGGGGGGGGGGVGGSSSSGATSGHVTSREVATGGATSRDVHLRMLMTSLIIMAVVVLVAAMSFWIRWKRK